MMMMNKSQIFMLCVLLAHINPGYCDEECMLFVCAFLFVQHIRASFCLKQVKMSADNYKSI